MNELGVSEAIDQLRREIGAAIDKARGEPLQFGLGEIELELQLELVAKAGVKGEAKWVVVSFGAEAGGERTRTHTVKLKLTPTYEGRDVDVNAVRRKPG